MLSKAELASLLVNIHTLNHYQLLKIGMTASRNEVQDAFHQAALRFHPDRYQAGGDSEVLRNAKQIYSKVVEAYRVLSNRGKREEYDRSLRTKLSPASAVASEASKKSSNSAGSAAGLKFFKLAQSAFQSGNIASAKMNTQLALNSDPENSQYKQFLQKLDLSLNKPK